MIRAFLGDINHVAGASEVALFALTNSTFETRSCIQQENERAMPEFQELFLLREKNNHYYRARCSFPHRGRQLDCKLLQ